MGVLVILRFHAVGVDFIDKNGDDDYIHELREYSLIDWISVRNGAVRLVIF